MDEFWSFVDNKKNKQWVWLAIDAETREIIGCYIGERSRQLAQALWDSLPRIYRQCAKNNTLRQRISRLLRKSLSFSKRIEHHIGAIWSFIGDHNRHIRAAIEEDKNHLAFLHPLLNGTTYF